MSVFLLDSNHVSPLLSLRHPLRQKVLYRFSQGDRFAICAPVIAEVEFGIEMLPRAEQNRAEWLRLQRYFLYYGLDGADASAAALLQATLRRRGWQLATVDALIAATTLRHDLVLLTKDGDFQPIPSLRIENWLV